MSRKLILLLSLLLLTACQQLARIESEGQPPAIRTVTLNEEFPIRPNRSNEYIQGGKIMPYEVISEYYPHCKLELREISEAARTVQPQTFTVSRIYQRTEFAGYKKVLLAGDGDSGQIMSTIYLYLQSEEQPDIFRLSCMRLDEAFDAHPISLDEMRTTLGDLMTLSL